MGLKLFSKSEEEEDLVFGSKIGVSSAELQKKLETAVGAGDPIMLVSELESTMEREPGSWALWFALIKAYRGSNNIEKAREAATHGLILFPLNPLIIRLYLDLWVDEVPDAVRQILVQRAEKAIQKHELSFDKEFIANRKV